MTQSQLKTKIYVLRRKVDLLQKAAEKVKAKKMTQKEAKPVAIQYLRLVLDEAQFELVNCLVENSRKQGRGRRYSKKLKVICLGIYLFDPRAYGNLRNILKAIPCENTLRNMIANNKIEEGFLPFVLQALKCCTVDFDKMSKYVILSWDAVNLSPELQYVRKEEDGDGDGFLSGLDSKSQHPATQANVLMVRSIFGDFKLPLAYFFHDPKLNAEKVHRVVDEAIDLVNETGLVVKGLVCDQCTAHTSMYKNIFKVSPEKPYIERNGNKIYCFFDPPHLLKNVKNNIKKGSLGLLQEDGKDKIINWQHIINFYIKDSSNILRVAPKLTDKHIFGKSVTNMSVPLAAQILSRTVAAGIDQAIATGDLPPEASHTARFCRLFNDLFDSCNSKLPKKSPVNDGSFPKSGIRDFVPPIDDEGREVTRRPLKLPVSKDSLHHSLWDEAATFIKNLSFVREFTGEVYRPPCLVGWELTISAFKMLWAEMEAEGCEKMPTGTINQDFVENFFSQVRYKNGNPDVTPRGFRNVYKFLLVHHIMDPSRGKNSNCLHDEARFLDIFKGQDFDKMQNLLPDPPKNATAPEPNSQSDELPPSRDEEVEIVLGDSDEGIEDYDPRKNPGDVKYSSYLARRLIQKSGKCGLCTAYFSVQKSEREKQHEILSLTENPHNSYSLIASKGQFQIFVTKASANFVRTLQDNFANRHLGILLAKSISSTQGFHILDCCPIHSEINKSFFVKIMTSSLMRLLLRIQNNSLKAFIQESRQKKKVASLADSSKTIPKLFCIEDMEKSLAK